MGPPFCTRGLRGWPGGPLVEFTKRPLQAEYSSYDAEAAAMLVVLAWRSLQCRIPRFILMPRLLGRRPKVWSRPKSQEQALGWQVKGHAGLLWNEVADRIAKACALGTVPATVLPEAFWTFASSDVIDAADYAQFDSQTQHTRPAHAFDPVLLPTLLQLEGLFRGAKQGKAPGPNGIPEWIWALDSRAAARAFLPIFLKSHFRLTEPVQFKSTTLIALFKGKGSPAVLANHRAIALLDGPGKALRRSMRPAFV